MGGAQLSGVQGQASVLGLRMCRQSAPAAAQPELAFCIAAATVRAHASHSQHTAVVLQGHDVMVPPHRPHQRPALRKPAQHGQGVGALEGKARGGGGGWAEGACRHRLGLMQS